MKAFVELYHLLDSSPGIKAKVDLLASFFENHSNSDGLWALALLSGQIGGAG